MAARRQIRFAAAGAVFWSPARADPEFSSAVSYLGARSRSRLSAQSHFERDFARHAPGPHRLRSPAAQGGDRTCAGSRAEIGTGRRQIRKFQRASLGERNDQPKTGTLPHNRAHLKFMPQHFRSVTRNPKTETISIPRWIELLEVFEDQFQLVRRDAKPGIVDLDP